MTILKVTPNRGKGHAMDLGVAHASTDVIFFADADIVGLTHQIVEETIRPVVDGSCEMFILMRNRKIYLLHRIMAFVPLFGRRAGPDDTCGTYSRPATRTGALASLGTILVEDPVGDSTLTYYQSLPRQEQKSGSDAD